MKNAQKKPFIFWFKDIDYEEIGLVGQKGVGLAEMMNLGLSIPNGFCLTSLAHSHFLKHTSLVPKIRLALGSLDFNNPRQLDSCSLKIRKMIFASPMPKQMAQIIMKKYLQLGGIFKEPVVAVRSSLVNEKLKAASFIDIKGEANVVEAVKKCWASLYHPENLRKRKNILVEQIAVLIQKMLQPRVIGSISPKNKKEVTIKPIARLSKQEIAELKKLAKKIRRYYFFPQKIEFAIEKRKIYILKTQSLT